MGVNCVDASREICRTTLDFHFLCSVIRVSSVNSLFNHHNALYYFQTEIVKRLNALINQLLPFLAQEHQQQVLQAVERAKQITVPELNAIIGVSWEIGVGCG